MSKLVKLYNLNDFLTPSQSCIKLTKTENQTEGDASSKQVSKKVKIDLSECLRCAGCITTTQTVIESQQSIQQLID